MQQMAEVQQAPAMPQAVAERPPARLQHGSPSRPAGSSRAAVGAAAAATAANPAARGGYSRGRVASKKAGPGVLENKPRQPPVTKSQPPRGSLAKITRGAK